MTYANGTLYNGIWKKGKKSWKGHVQFVNGDEYEGRFEEGVISGEGIYSFADGKVYKGNFKEGKLNVILKTGDSMKESLTKEHSMDQGIISFPI